TVHGTECGIAAQQRLERRRDMWEREAPPCVLLGGGLVSGDLAEIREVEESERGVRRKVLIRSERHSLLKDPDSLWGAPRLAENETEAGQRLHLERAVLRLPRGRDGLLGKRKRPCRL